MAEEPRVVELEDEPEVVAAAAGAAPSPAGEAAVEVASEELPYSWDQSLAEVTVTVPVPSGIRGKQIHFLVTKDHLELGIKGQDPIIQGDLFKPVQVDGCFWTKDGDVVEVQLEKVNKMEWWKSVIQGHKEIDTSSIEPENSKLSDLDPEARAMVEKMMKSPLSIPRNSPLYDQRAKQEGKPTSDQIQQEHMLKKFMAEHPEMDFSNATINYS